MLLPAIGVTRHLRRRVAAGSGSKAKMDTVSELLAAFLTSVVTTEPEENAQIQLAPLYPDLT